MPKHEDKLQAQAVDLPKNIQQIGSTDIGMKVYLEDYSGTYIRRILSDDSDVPRHGILLGRRKTDQKHNYIFIQAVIAVKPEIKEIYWKYDWNYIYELMQKYFLEDGKEKLEILGWSMAIDGEKRLDISELEKMHKSNFEGNRTIALTLDMQEGKEQFYILENNQFHAVSGYYIYYEKNKSMQTYVLENQEGECVETEDIVKGNRESYRTILQKRKEVVQRRQTVSLLYVGSTFLVMLVVVLGITMMNNYEKMKKMQETISELSKSVINEEDDKKESNDSIVAASTQTPVPQATESAEAVQAMSNNIVVSEEPAKEAIPTESAQTKPVQTGPAKTEPVQTEPVSTEPAQTEPVPTASAQAGKKRYEIQPGDTLLAISLKVYNTDQMVDKICEYNDIEDSDQIIIGDVLILP